MPTTWIKSVIYSTSFNNVDKGVHLHPRTPYPWNWPKSFHKNTHAIVSATLLQWLVRYATNFVLHICYFQTTRGQTKTEPRHPHFSFSLRSLFVFSQLHFERGRETIFFNASKNLGFPVFASAGCFSSLHHPLTIFR